MKRIPFKIRTRKEGLEYLQEILVEDYNELVYYVSPRFNKDIKTSYAFYDKQTGLIVCSGKNKQELINNYNRVEERYNQLRNSIDYKKIIKKYEELIKGVR